LVEVDPFYWLEKFSWFPKENVTRSRGRIGDWGVAVTHIYSAKTRVKSR
jgi:hypothetical protein